MKALIYVCFLWIVLSCGNTDNSNNKEKEPLPQVAIEKIDTLRTVEQHRQSKLTIDSLKPYLDSLSKDVYETTEGGQIKTFFKQSDTLKKEMVYYGEMGKRFVEVYQENGSPFLIKHTEFRYETPIYSSDKISIKDKILNEYYLKEENLIYWTKNDSVMPSSKYLAQEKNIIVEEE